MHDPNGGVDSVTSARFCEPIHDIENFDDEVTMYFV